MTRRRRHGSLMGAEDEEQPLQLEEDGEFHRRERKLRRVGTVGLCALLVAAFTGVFGSGPLSDAEISSGDQRLTAEFQRFARNGAGTILRLSIGQPKDGTLIQLAFNREFAEAIKIDQILPEPARVTTAGERYLFDFASAASDTSSIVFRYRPESLGSLRVVVTAAESQVRFQQFVYP